MPMGHEKGDVKRHIPTAPLFLKRDDRNRKKLQQKLEKISKIPLDPQPSILAPFPIQIPNDFLLSKPALEASQEGDRERKDMKQDGTHGSSAWWNPGKPRS